MSWCGAAFDENDGHSGPLFISPLCASQGGRRFFAAGGLPNPARIPLFWESIFSGAKLWLGWG